MERILIIDFGSQYTQLIARRVRELNIYCEIYPFHNFPAPDQEVKGIILSGSPFSVHDANFADIVLDGLLGKYPVLAVCYGAQLIAKKLGGTVMRAQKREYGRAMVHLLSQDDAFLKDVQQDSQVWMSHADTISKLPAGFELIANSGSIDIAAYKSSKDVFDQPVYCLQFHPEVIHSTEGKKLLHNFCVAICGCHQDWTPESFITSTIDEIRKKVGDDHVMLALSGGVDSTVAAGLLHQAIGKNLFCFFVNNGLLRKNEFEQVLKTYEQMGLTIDGVDASERFLNALKDVTDPETKRKIIGEQFIRVFEEESHKLDHIQWLAQGTIYPDVIESISVHGPSQTIKSHHNVGGLPEKMHLKIIEPLRLLFKDEVRHVGAELKIPPEILNRHPFPGPGLSIRILGAITPEKIKLLQEADEVFITALKKMGLYNKVWQAGVILLPVQSVGVMGDERTYENVVCLRAVESTDGMTADWCHLPYDFLSSVSNEIINSIKGINRVVYDISSKPPSTIEWE
ncbi:MAG: glutamine-hydrolyzing GMP synthase [Chitinophagaceae bacterium]|nr:glutamine-hydrolyzing GMP synthase [Chitinophagaceae bacterium]